MLVYKILRPDEWAAFDRAGETAGARIDLEDGFVHLSTGDQVVETAERHFADAGDLVLVAFETTTLGDALRWEPSRGGALFPHLYRPLRRSEVAWVEPLPRDGDRHRFPKL